MILIRYVDGTQASCLPEHWAALPSEGVDCIEWEGLRVEEMSIYWLYECEQGWKLGGGPVGYGPIKEHLLREGKWEDTRQPTMPDLGLDRIKLGAWRCRA